MPDQLEFPLQSKQSIYKQRYAQLNPEQQLAVDTIEGPVMVLAGPGTGKTEIIAMRIANILLQSQLNPANILCLTFTESGVTAMRERLFQIIGRAAYFVKVHTFHSFCNEVIQNNPGKFEHIGFEAEVLTDVDKLDILEKLIDSLDEESVLKPFGDTYHYLRYISSAIKTLKQEGFTPEKYAELIDAQQDFWQQTTESFDEFTQLHHSKLSDLTFNQLKQQLEAYENPLVVEITKLIDDFFETAPEQEKERKKSRTALKNRIKKIYQTYSDEKTLKKQNELLVLYEQYQEILGQMSRYDYEDMIIEVVKKFKQDQNLLLDYQEQFQYILVDEYQDTNSAQNETISLLGSFFDNPNIFVVGDDDQAIYRFQGASLENLLYFYKLYQNTIKIISLKKNYRSTAKIIAASTSLIENDDTRIVAELPGVIKNFTAAKQGEGEEIEIMKFTNSDEELATIADKILALSANNVPASEIAVLFRKNADAYDMAQMLGNRGVNYKIERGENILDDQEVLNLVELFQFLIDPSNDYLFFKILNLPFLQVDQLDLVKILRYVRQEKQAFGDILLSPGVLASLELVNEQLITEKVQLVSSWQQLSHEKNAAELFEEIVLSSGMLEYYLNSENGYSKLLKINTLQKELKRLSEQNSAYEIGDFVRHLNLMREYGLSLTSEVKLGEEDGVRLMTAHASKGLQFEHVFIARASEGNWEKRRVSDHLRLPIGITKTQLQGSKEEEERRLMYVAMTRAKHNVYISYTSENDQGKAQLPSLYLSEIDDVYKYEKEFELKQEQLKKIILNNLGYGDFELDSNQKLVKSILSDYKLNVTHLLAYEECPRCFFYHYILKIPRSRTKHTALGSAVHFALKEIVRKYRNSSELPGLEFVVSSFKTALVKEKLEDDEYKQAALKGEEILTAFYSANKENFKPDSLVEYNFSKQDLIVEGIPVTGIIDRIDFLDKKTAKVVDYKTGNPNNKYSKLDPEKSGEYYKQLVFYKLLADNSSWVDWSVQSGEIQFIEPKNNGTFLIKEFILNEQQTQELLKEIKQVYSTIVNAEFSQVGIDCENKDLHQINWNI